MNNIKGTKEWAIWHLKSIAIPRLIDDLQRHEETGYPEDRCEAVKEALKKVIDSAEARPASVWHPSVTDEIRQLRQIYVKWNDNGQGADLVNRIDRKTKIHDMRKIRGLMKRKMNKKASELQGDFATNEDLEIARESYNAFGELADKYPDVFRSLKAGVSSFKKAF